MNLSFSYLTEPKEFAEASLIFVETKPVLKFLLLLMNIAIFCLLILITFKGYKVGLEPQEWSMILMIVLWLFGRKKFNRWVFFKKFNKQTFDKQTLNLNFSRNGLIWSGEKFAKGEVNWSQIKYVIELKNGFILPVSGTQFLWLPERVFEPVEQKQSLIDLIREMNVPIKSYLQRAC